MRATPQTYAITLVCHERMRLFQRETNANLMIATLYRYRDAGRFLLHGFVIMPDHAHLLLSPTASLEQTIGIIKGGYSFAMRKQFRHSVWQEGYYAHRIIDESDFDNQLAYIAANPERRRLIDCPYVHTRTEFILDPKPLHLGG